MVVDARRLLHVLDCIYLVSIGIWLALLTFQRVAGTGRGDRGSQSSERVHSLYMAGTVAGATALGAFTSGVLVMPEYRGFRAMLQIALLLGCTLVMVGLANSDGLSQSQGTSRDQRQERSRTRLEIGVFLAITILLCLHLVRPMARGVGVTEPTVEERARASYSRWLEKQRAFEAGIEDGSMKRSADSGTPDPGVKTDGR